MTTTRKLIESATSTGKSDQKVPYDKTRKFVLRFDDPEGEYSDLYIGEVHPHTLETQVVFDRSEAMVLDWRDNERVKAKFFSALFGLPVVPELLPPDASK